MNSTFYGRVVGRVVAGGVLIGAAAGLPRDATAQRGAGAKTTRAQQPDTAKKAPPGVSLDFQDQDLKVVLDALAAAGDLNVSLTNIPAQRTTVHMGRPVTRDGMIELLKNVAESNGLKVVESPSLIQISGPAPETRETTIAQQQRLAAQFAAQQNQAQAMHLFTYRLRHASAVQLAPVLSNLFSGYSNTAGGRNTFTIPNANGGFTTINTGPPNNVVTPFVVGGGGGGGGGGRAGRGAVFGGGGNQNGAGGAANNPVAAAIANAFQAASGSLSSQAGDIRIIAEETSNSLLVRATDSDWALVQSVIQGVDVRPLQVLIEVTIAEVQRTRSLDVGVSGSVKRKSKDGTVSATAPSQASALDLIAELTGGHGAVDYDVALSALEERGNVRVLSLPVIIAQNNRQASLNVGSSRPFVQISQTVPNDPTGRVQTVQYIDVGTVLTITPTINVDGYVNLQVTQTDNSATNEVEFDAPVINKREATTQIFIRDGQTTVIGGLADNTRTGNESGLPLLSRIPLIGPLLFGQVSKSDATNELFLFLTPHIISSDGDIDKLRDAVKEGSDLLKQVNVGPHIQPKSDTLNAPTRPDTPPAKPPVDSTRRDSLTTLRRRPPPAPRDSTPAPPPRDTLLVSRPPNTTLRWR